MSEYMYAALSPLPTYPRPPRRRQSNPPTTDSASRPRSRRTLRRFSRPSTSNSLAQLSTTSSEGPSGAASTASLEHGQGSPGKNSNKKPSSSHSHPNGSGTTTSHERTSSNGLADGNTADPRASTSTGGSTHSRVTAASLASTASAKSFSFVRRSRKSTTGASIRPAPNTYGIPAGDLRNVAMYPDSEAHKSSSSSKQLGSFSAPFSRAESVSSTSVTTALSSRTVPTDPSAGGDPAALANSKPFTQRNGRTYINDPSSSYPLPIDLTELHRQALRTLLLIQVHGAPLANPALLNNPPKKILEIGCGPGFWSMMCHRYFKGRGHADISFTGIDIAPLAPGSANTPSDSIKPDRDMNWKFIQHDVRNVPWPFADGEFDLVFNKDMTSTVPMPGHVTYIEELLRVLKPGGHLEIWDTDFTIRMLRPHVPGTSTRSGNQTDEQELASSLGAYIINLNTPLSAPLNTFLVEYNTWLTRAFESRELITAPCTMMNHYLLQESDTLQGIGSHRFAIPLSEVRWEREGVGGVVTKDGKSYVEMKGERPPHQKVEKKTLTAGQAALRRTALLTLVEQIQALEPILRETSGKSQDEWDVWMGKMTTDLMSENGTTWGECLETGAWWAKKKGK